MSDKAQMRFTGRVKWFNNKQGYGFITITDSDQSGKDVYVNHKEIKVDSDQYTYLVQGEYVTFEIVSATGHENQAGNVRGIQDGKLMCETRNELKVERSKYNNEKKKVEKPVTSETKPEAVSASSTSGAGTEKKRGRPTKPKVVASSEASKGEWKSVVKGGSKKAH